jgi:hypothetical protein
MATPEAKYKIPFSFLPFNLPTLLNSLAYSKYLLSEVLGSIVPAKLETVNNKIKKRKYLTNAHLIIREVYF